MNHIRLAADRAIFDVLLLFALRKIYRHDNFFTARAANVGSFVIHNKPQMLLRTADILRTIARHAGLRYMASSAKIDSESSVANQATLAKALAPEDIRPGDFVTPLYVIAEVPSFWWRADVWNLPVDEPVRIRLIPPSDGAPLKVRSVCVPFVLVKTATGDQSTIDVRTCQLARLDEAHAARAWKACKKAVRRARAQAATKPQQA
jgi:hypothetical protein